MSCLDSAATLLAYAGRTEVAILIGRFLARRDPLDQIAISNLAYIYYYAQDWDSALAELEHAMTLSRDAVALSFLAGAIRVQRGGPGDLRIALELASKEPEAGWRLELLAIAEHALGQTAQSDAALDELIEKHAQDWSFNIASVLAFRHERDRAFEWLERAVKAEDTGIATASVEPLLASLHDDPRWPQFLEMIGQDPDRLAAIALKIDLPK